MQHFFFIVNQINLVSATIILYTRDFRSTNIILILQDYSFPIRTTNKDWNLFQDNLKIVWTSIVLKEELIYMAATEYIEVAKKKEFKLRTLKRPQEVLQKKIRMPS